MNKRLFAIPLLIALISIIEINVNNTSYMFYVLLVWIGLFLGINKNKIKKLI